MKADIRTATRTASRAQRFALRLPVLYRRAGETSWRSGTTENISDSGAVIRGTCPTLPPTAVEVIISLSSSLGRPAGCLAGRGDVVRSFTLVGGAHESVFALRFTTRRLVPRVHLLDAS